MYNLSRQSLLLGAGAELSSTGFGNRMSGNAYKKMEAAIGSLACVPLPVEVVKETLLFGGCAGSFEVGEKMLIPGSCCTVRLVFYIHQAKKWE